MATWITTPMRSRGTSPAWRRSVTSRTARMTTTTRLQAADRHHRQRAGGGQGGGRSQRCACHSVLDDCCPDRLRGVLDAGATRVGLLATGGAPAGVASMIDHTLLKPDATRSQHRGAVPRGGAVQVRHRLRQPDVGGAGRAPAGGQRRRRLLGGRISARRDDRRRQGLRDAGARSSTARAKSTW